MLAGTAALSGCVETDESIEQLSISILDVGRVPYIIYVPTWISADGVQPVDWQPYGRVHSGQVTEFSVALTERGPAFRIAGNGTVTIGFADVPRQGAPDFPNGRMSLGTGADGIKPVFFVEQGDVDLNLMYQGQSMNCFLPVSAGWNSQGTGWHVAQTYSRQDPSFDCL